MIPDDHLLRVSSIGVSFYVLRDGDELYLIDGGFLGSPKNLTRALESKGWAELPIAGILVTHGHLDHILHIRRLAEKFQAWIAAPELDLPYYSGRAKSRGWGKVAGLSEAIGRLLFRFQPFTPDLLYPPDHHFEILGGLRAVHLPGHTPGHTGFYSEKYRGLFSGDLFASLGRWTHLPPRILNNDSSVVRKSLEYALSLDLVGVYPSHTDGSDPREHLVRMKRLGQRKV